MTMHWGILGPGEVESIRRVRTLGLAASVRNFNELAVPGLGGVWFAKQLFLATLGVLVAENASARGRKVTRIGVANAIEALACWQSLGAAPGDGRLRGSDKLAGRNAADFSFDNASKPHFYVTQPMRMASVAALPALGLVEAAGSRFNAFSCSSDGLHFLEAACAPFHVHRVGVIEYLVRWVMGEADNVNTDAMRAALSPLTPLPPEARSLLRERLQQTSNGESGSKSNRRRDALNWVQSRRRGAAPAHWRHVPTEISDPAHWADMLAGARFSATQSAAYALLENIERQMPTARDRFAISGPLSPSVRDGLARLRAKASSFLECGHDDREANVFSRELVTGDDEDVLRRLAGRDGRILRLAGEHIIAGPAFIGAGQLPEENSAAAPVVADPDWPEDISYRVRNLWWLGLDLDGEMNEWLNPPDTEAAHV